MMAEAELKIVGDKDKYAYFYSLIAKPYYPQSNRTCLKCRRIIKRVTKNRICNSCQMTNKNIRVNYKKNYPNEGLDETEFLDQETQDDGYAIEV